MLMELTQMSSSGLWDVTLVFGVEQHAVHLAAAWGRSCWEEEAGQPAAPSRARSTILPD